jgi:hypothetical protein
MSATPHAGWVVPTATVARSRPVADAWVDLYWLPFPRPGEGRLTGRARRGTAALFHSLLVVRSGAATYAIEMSRARPGRPEAADRGVVAEGPVGLPWLAWSQRFRYEVRCWRLGRVEGLAESVESPQRLSADDQRARRLLHLVPEFPLLTWGRDERRTGDPWSSGSLVAWLLLRSGHDVQGVRPPAGGRAPGWAAGLAVAQAEARGLLTV